MSKTKCEAIAAMKVLQPFIGRSQMSCLADACRGEEKQFFFDRLCELAALVQAMPKTYDQDGLGDKAVAHLHYFTGSCDWWITEKDKETADEPGQHQAFGLASFGDEPELGYISIVELLANGAELDLYWTPKTLGEIRGKTTMQPRLDWVPIGRIEEPATPQPQSHLPSWRRLAIQ